MAILAAGIAVGLSLAQARMPAPAPRPDPATLKAKVTRALPLVRSMAAEAEVVSAVAAQNAQPQAQTAIQKTDKEWMATRGVSDHMRRYLENPCAKALRAVAARNPAVVEAFAMDGQGALVCSIAKTTDYWQGDEAKWQKAFAGGRGAEFVDEVQYDESSQAYCIQVSVPVKQRDQVVGALTVGFDLDRLDHKPEAKRGP